VLISGFISHLEKDWEEPRHAHFLERLGAIARLIRFDKRGTVLSDQPPGVADLEQRNDDVHAVMDAVDSRRAVLRSLGATSGLCATVPADARVGRRPTAPTGSLPASASPGRSERPRDRVADAPNSSGASVMRPITDTLACGSGREAIERCCYVLAFTELREELRRHWHGTLADYVAPPTS
jgi:pimeloyl-ACP methyl ester carboxylesterase